VRELVIIITDLYLAGAPEPAGASAAMPALEHIARFAHQRGPQSDWRAWVARWLGLTQYAQLPPASIAAAGQPVPGETVWFASPLHLIAGVGRVHLRRSGRLCLAPQTLARLAADFNSTFAGSGFALAPLASGEFLLGAPRGLSARTCDPARVPQAGLLEALPLGEGAAVLRRLGAEIEMWLHAHPLNEARARQGEPPLSQLWIWGGGEAAAGAGGGAPPGAAAGQGHGAVVYGSDPYLAGLACLGGLGCAPLPPAQPLAPAGLEARALMALEVSAALRREPGWDLAEALAALDRSWIAAGLEALRSGTVARLTLLANDRLWRLARADRLRRWRRRRGGLGALA
jgi:hypothetical protein